MSKTKSADVPAAAAPTHTDAPTPPRLSIAEVEAELARMRAERDEAREYADRADTAARDAHAELNAMRSALEAGDAPPRARPLAGQAMKLRALHGIVFSIRGERRRLRAGETVDAQPADIEDDGLTLGRDFEIVR